MGKPLRVLNIEDSEADAILLNRHLASAGYDVTSERADTKTAMEAALRSGDWQVVLCDYAMPKFDAVRAHQVLRESGHDIPFIIISGTVGEETAVQALLAGAHDYIPKNNLTRLVAAIEREVKEAENRRERQTAEEALRLSEERYRVLFDYAPDGIIISSPDDYYLDANASMCRMLGYGPDELVGMHASDIVIQSEVRELDSEFALVQSSPDYNREWHFRRKDGSVFPGEVIATIMPDGNLLAMIRDISERKQAAAAVSEASREKAESLALIGTILSRAPIGFAFHDLELRYVRINETLAAVNGLSVERHLGRTLREILPKLAPLLEPIMRNVIDTGKPVVDFELSGETPAEPGKAKHWLVSFYPVRMESGEILGVGVLVSEVTERKRAEEELRESEEKFSGAFEFAPIGVALVSPEGHWLKVNRALCDLIGYTEAELLEGTFQEITHRDDLEEDQRNVHRLLSGEADNYQMEKRYIHKLGHPVFACLHVSLVRYANGDPRYFISQIQDITEQKAAEQQLQLHSLILNAIGQAAIVTDPEGNITYWNRFAERTYGWTSSEVLGRNIIDVTPTQASRAQGVEILETLKRGESWSGEFTVQHRDGTSFPAFITNTPLMNAEGTVESIIGISLDVTERKKSEEELRESEYLLAAAQRIAHLGSWVMDIAESGGVIENTERWSDEHYRIYGLEPGEVEITDQVFYNSVHPEDRERLADTIRESIEQKVPFDIEHRIILPDGRERVLHAIAEMVRNPKTGELLKLLGSVQDITERKLAAYQIQEKSALLEAQLNSAIDGILIVDEHGRQIIKNQRFVDLFKMPQSIADDPDDAKQVQWVTALMNDPKKFVEKVVYLYANPDETSRDEIELKDGTILDRYSAPVLGKDNKNYGRIWTFRDMTSQKRVTEALRESDEKFRHLADNITDAFWIRSPDMNQIYYISPAYERIWGRTLKSDYANPHEWYDFILPIDRQRVKEVYAGLMKDVPNIEIEYRIVRPDGDIRWVRARGFQVRDAEGHLIRLAGIVTDITDRKHNIEALSESEERYRSVVNTAPDVIVTIGEDNTICFINPAAERIFGYEMDEVKGKSLSMLMPERLRHHHEAGFKRYIQSGVKQVSWDLVEVTGLHKSGLEIPITISFSEYVQNGRRYFTGIIRDISDRKRAMEALQESEERNRELVENALDIIYTHDLKGNYTSINKAGETISGYTKAEVMKMNMADTIPAAQLEKARQMIAAKLAGDDVTAYELELIAKDGHGVPVEVKTRIIYQNGVSVGVQGIARDITDRKASEAARLASERKYQALFTLAPVGIYQSLPDGSMTTANAALAHMLGYDSADEFLGTNFHDIYFHADERRALLDKYERRGYATDIDLQWKRKDGSPVWIQLTAQAIKDPAGETEYYEGFVRDITERKSAEKEIEQTMKRLNAAQRIGKIGDWTWDRSSGAITWSQEIFTIAGRDPDLGPPTTYEEQQEYYLAESWALMKEKGALAIETGETQDFELIIVRKDGKQIHAQAMCEGQTDETGEVSGLRGTLQDISARRVAEAALRESESRYHSLFENMLEGYAYCETIFEEDKLVDLVYTEVNGAFETLTGLTDVVGKKITEIIPGVHETHANLFDIYGRVARTGMPEKFETYLPQLGIWLSITAYSSRRDSFVAVFDNITERKLAEAALNQSKEQLTLAAESVNLGIWDWNIGEDILEWDDRMYELYGIRAEDFVGAYDAWQKGLHPDDRKTGDDNIRAALSGERPFNNEFRVLWPNGEVHNIEARALIQRDDAGNPVRMIGVNWDITDRKIAERLVIESKEQLTLATEAANIGIWDWDLAEGTIKWDARMYDLYGNHDEDFSGPRRTWNLNHHPDDENRVMEELATAFKGPGDFHSEFRVVWPNGEVRHLESSAKVLRDTNGTALRFIGVNWDITERKAAEAALKAAEENYRSIFENAVEGIFQSTSEGRFISANPAMARLLGFDSSEELIELRNDIGSQHYVDPAARIELSAILEEHDVVAAYEAEVYRRNGTKIWTQENIRAIRGNDGVIAHYEGSMEDITDRIRAEERLRSSEENLAKSQEIAHLGSWELMIPEAGSINEGSLRWSDEVFRIFGYQPNAVEVTNDLFFNAVHPDDRADIAAAMAKALNEGLDYKVDHRIILPDGTERFVQEHSELVRDRETGKIVSMVGTIQDVTGQKQLEDQFRQSQKMEAVGVMAGGIAHDFNNLLTAINGYSDLTLRKMSPEEPLRRNIEEVKKAGDRAAELTSQLLAFSRKQVLMPSVHSLNSVIVNIEKMLRRIIRENIELRTILDANLGNIKADPGQIEQVIMNLVVNARDAMPDGGTLTIETRDVYLDDQYVSQKLAIEPGPFARMTVTDTGVGMDEATQQHIFEPFFTTKEVGKGTGLGLSMVYGTIKQSGGDIMVYSEPGHGTTFKIYLPRVDEQIEKPKWPGEREEKYLGTETILLVEDEEIVRRLVSEILTGNGYTVLEAENGKAALAILSSYQDRIDMLLTDVIMPKMSGVELKEVVIQTLPDIKVLFMSGYTDDAITTRGIIDADVAFIEKPFTPDALSRKVRKILEL